MPAPQNFWQVLAGFTVLWLLIAFTGWLIFVGLQRQKALREGYERKKRVIAIQERGLGGPTPGGQVGLEVGDGGPSDADLAQTEDDLKRRWRQGPGR